MPRPTKMGATERSIRSGLESALTSLRSTMNRIPVPLHLAGDVDDRLSEALGSLSDAEAFVRQLAALSDATEEGALLAASASTALESIRHSLALVFAELDAAGAA